jgi:integrase
LKHLQAAPWASSAKSRHLEDQRVVVLESDEWCAQYVLELLVQASLGCGAGHLVELAAFSDPRTRGIFLKWRDELGTLSPRQADLTWTVLCKAVSFGLDRGLVATHPFLRGGKLYQGSRVEHVWSIEDEERFLSSAPEVMRLAFRLALWTGQRQGDLRRVPWSAYDGKFIRLKQSKSAKPGKSVTIPVGGPLKAMLDEAAKAKKGPLILTRPDGQSFTRDAFKCAWQRAREKAGIKDLTFHDLRGTAVTRLAVAGCTEAEIASITGHSLGDVRSILDAHYLHRDPQLAENAIRKLEAANTSGTNLQTALQTGHESGHGGT